MDFFDEVHSPRLAYLLSQWLSTFLNVNPQPAIDAMITAQLGQSVNSVFSPAGSTFPATYYAECAGQRILLLSGADNALQGTRYYAGLTSQTAGLPTRPLNPYFDSWTTSVNALINTGHFSQSGDYTIAGHSLGGALAHYAGSAIIPDPGTTFLRTISFGAPKSLNPTQASLLSRDYVARWMTPEDAVPLIPPTFEECPPLYLTAGPVNAIRLGYFVHPAGGLSITSASEVFDSVLPSQASLGGVAAIARWIVQQDQPSSTPHSITTYQARLGVWAARNPRPGTVHPRGAAVEQPNAARRSDNTVAERQAAALIFRQGQAQDFSPTVIPRPQRMVAQRFNRVWVVTWEGQFVAVGPTKRKARAIARFGNQFLDRLQSAGMVSADQLPAMFQNYLASASDPTQGFVPTLATTWPTPS